MNQTLVLKILYTGAAVVLGGLTAVHVIPEALQPFTASAMTYLVLHSFLKSAKSGAPQG